MLNIVVELVGQRSKPFFEHNIVFFHELYLCFYRNKLHSKACKSANVECVRFILYFAPEYVWTSCFHLSSCDMTLNLQMLANFPFCQRQIEIKNFAVTQIYNPIKKAIWFGFLGIGPLSREATVQQPIVNTAGSLRHTNCVAARALEC